MSLLDSKLLTGNAFRVLGLPGDASQAQVEGAARRMRIWAESGNVPETPWDLPGYGAISRTRHEIDLAAAKLLDPLSRIQERLFWFTDLKVAGHEYIFEIYLDEPEKHDEVLRRLAWCVLSDPEFKFTERWEPVLDDWREMMQSPVYFVWFELVEERGQFEKRVTKDEVRAALANQPVKMAQLLADKTCDAMDVGNARLCTRLIRLLRMVSPDESTTERLISKIGDLVEDLLRGRCDTICNAIYHKVKWKPAGFRDRQANGVICRLEAKKVAETVEPLLGLLPLVDTPEGERLLRLKFRIERMFRNLGVGWSKAGESSHSTAALRQAAKYRPVAAKEKPAISLKALPVPPGNWSWLPRGRPYGIAVLFIVIAVLRVISFISDGPHQVEQTHQDLKQYTDQLKLDTLHDELLLRQSVRQKNAAQSQPFVIQPDELQEIHDRDDKMQSQIGSVHGSQYSEPNSATQPAE